MWRATIETEPIFANADYGGGVIITDWYNENGSNNESMLMVQFLSNEIRADGLKLLCIIKNV